MSALNPAETEYGQAAQELDAAFQGVCNLAEANAISRAIDLLNKRHMEILAEIKAARLAEFRTLLDDGIDAVDSALYASPDLGSNNPVTLNRADAFRIMLALRRAKEDSDGAA